MKTSMYLMTRTGFFKLCMSANGVKARECRTMFAKVYELALKFATNMRIKMAKDGTSIYEKEKDVQDRIKEKIDKNSEAKLRIKIKELEEQLKRNEELKQQAESERDNKNTAYGDSQRKRRELVLQVEEKDKQITKLDKRKTKYMNNYKNSTLKLKELNEKVEKYEKKSVNNNSEQIKKRLQKYIDKSKKQEEIVKNLEDQIGQYKKKLEDKIRRNNCLIKLVNKLKKDIEKLKKQEESSDEESSSQSDEEDEEEDEENKHEEEEKKEEEKSTKKYTETVLKGKTVQQLKDICKSCGIGGYSGKNRSPLIKFMLDHKKLQ